MSKIAAWLRHLLTEEPALTAWVTSGGLAALFAFVFHFTHAQEAAAATVLASLATLWTAVWAHPPEVALGSGALAAIFTAIGTFGFHPSAHLIALAGTILAVVMALLHRSNLSPWFRPTKPPAVPPG